MTAVASRLPSGRANAWPWFPTGKPLIRSWAVSGGGRKDSAGMRAHSAGASTGGLSESPLLQTSGTACPCAEESNQRDELRFGLLSQSGDVPVMGKEDHLI